MEVYTRQVAYDQDRDTEALVNLSRYVTKRNVALDCSCFDQHFLVRHCQRYRGFTRELRGSERRQFA